MDTTLEFAAMCTEIFGKSKVTTKPLIHSGRTSKDANVPIPEASKELRGGISVRGFYELGKETIFDIRVSDVDAPSYVDSKPEKVLENAEKAKKRKYAKHCHDGRKSFVPLVFSADGLRGKEASAAMKRLASLLADKWQRQYSEMCGYVRSRMAISLAHSLSHCIRGNRDPARCC